MYVYYTEICYSILSVPNPIIPLLYYSTVSILLSPMIGVQVVKERIRVLEFMKDYDKLRSGRIPVTSFNRALDLCGFGLSQAEVSALEKRYVCVCLNM